VGFLVDDLQTTCDALEAKGYRFKKKPSDGKMRSIAFAYDPDGMPSDSASASAD
jgi:lactoylglutathione lyase